MLSPRPLPSEPPAGDPRRSRPRRRATGPDREIQARWVERLKAGDAETLRDVIGAFGERITAVVAGLLRDRDAVEDVVQETFTKAWFRIRSFQGGSSLYTWLYRVAVNTTKDHIKTRSRRPAHSLDEQRAAEIPADLPRSLEGLERREARLRVRAAIDRLPPHFRTVLALREIEGMGYREIAEVLGLSLGTVESRLFRARQRLRDILGGTEEGPGHGPDAGLEGDRT